MDDLTGSEVALDTGSDTGAGDSLQSQMTGDFFDYDDGLGAVVNQDGDPFTKADGKYYQSIDEYKASLGQNNNQPKPAPVQQPKPAQPNAQAKPQPSQSNGFESFYKKDSGFDIASVLGDAPKFNEFKYERQNNPIDQGQQNNFQQPPQAPVDPKVADANTLKEYRETLESSALKPIERAYQTSLAGYQREGVEMPKHVYDAFNAEYSQLKNAIDEAVSSKKDELLENRFKEREETANFTKIQEKGIENFDRISAQYFPNLSSEQSKERLSKLVFGYADNTGKFIRGYGADIVDHAFDLANNGKTYKTKEEWEGAYNKWWSTYASNPKNIAYVAQRAWDRFIAANIDSIRDGYRSTWEQEQRDKLKQTQQNPFATRGGNAQVDSAGAQLDSYFTPPSRNM